VYEIFSPYVTAKVDEKKKQRDPAWAKREAIIEEVGHSGPRYYGYQNNAATTEPTLDSRWLDLAVQLQDLRLVYQLIRPGHAAANAFLKKSFDETLKKGKQLNDYHDLVASMIRAAHPEATDAYVAVLEKFGKKADYVGYWIGNLIVELPKTAIPRLEALIPTLNDRVADSILGYIQQLREKP